MIKPIRVWQAFQIICNVAQIPLAQIYYCLITLFKVQIRTNQIKIQYLSQKINAFREKDEPDASITF